MVLLKDDFSDSSTGWGTGTDATSSVEYANRGLSMTGFKTDDFVYSTPGAQAYQGVHIDVTDLKTRRKLPGFNPS